MPEVADGVRHTLAVPPQNPEAGSRFGRRDALR